VVASAAPTNTARSVSATAVSNIVRLIVVFLSLFRT
jgi:hypothetical protein